MFTAQVEVLTGLLEKHGIILEGCNFPSCLTEIVVVLGVANGRHSRKGYLNPRASIAAMANPKSRVRPTNATSSPTRALHLMFAVRTGVEQMTHGATGRDRTAIKSAKRP